MDIEERVRLLERRNRVLSWGCSILLGFWCLAATTASARASGSAGATGTPSSGDILTVRGIIVIDENGTERVHIGAPVPDPLVLGKRLTRGGNASGILLFDEEGNERSGYLTTNGYPNALLTLDGMEEQHVLFVSEPQGATTLMMWDKGNRLVLSPSGSSPGVKLIKDGKEVWSAPPTDATEGGK